MGEIVQGVKGVIEREGNVLVLTGPDGEPDLPGGRIESGERLEQGLHREIQVETGLKVGILRASSKWSFTKNAELRVTGMTYDCHYLGGNLKLSPEHSGYRWVTHEELQRTEFSRPYLPPEAQRWSPSVMGTSALVAKGMIMQEDKVLVLTRPDGKPDLPGGAVESGESFEQALQREVQEETGLKVKIKGQVSKWELTKGPGRMLKGITFLCRYLGGRLKLSPEHTGYRWMTTPEMAGIGFNGHIFRRQTR